MQTDTIYCVTFIISTHGMQAHRGLSTQCKGYPSS